MKNNKKPRKLFIIALLVPVLILFIMSWKPLYTVLNGEEVVLASIPVDPRDLFYGDYVTLDLEVEQVPEDKFLGDELKKKLKGIFNNGDSISTVYESSEPIEVYVSIEKQNNGIFSVQSVSISKPDGLFLQGKLDPYNFTEENNIKVYHIDYGIERFYVEEGTGLDLEKSSREGKVLVTLKIYDGYPVLREINGVK